MVCDCCVLASSRYPAWIPGTGDLLSRYLEADRESTFLAVLHFFEPGFLGQVIYSLDP